jgi:spermidine/putrescine transport system substrate-binding protein
MNFFYRPSIQALIEDWVNYLCPVPAAQPLIAGRLDDPTVANSPLIFPTPSMQSRLRGYYEFKGIDDHEEWLSIFNPIIQS